MPREVLKWELKRKGVPKTYTNVIEVMYDGSSTRIKSICRETEHFMVRVGAHKKSALSI